MKKFKTLFIAATAVLGMSLASCSKADKSDVTDRSDKSEVSDKSDVNEKPVVVSIIDFNATWCGPCKQFAPIFEAAAEKYGDKIKFESVDVDQNPALAEKYGVQSIPMVVLLDKAGNVVDQNIGYMDAAQFEQLIEKNI